MSPAPSGLDWSAIIAEAYAAEARPPLTDDLVARIRGDLGSALADGPQGDATSAPDRANAALDAFELALRSVVGPRVERLDEQVGVAVMKHRSEAGQPLRAFGGQ